ncbi:hypothetical protein K458DRAFT_451069 [Lentithecium fluviatile CBS 122367]|uniref:Uncharacterized protein n=1 Tax=Lentithecium fluviatile CBS 122367 TaxID=1168545 RepID=A0A6G1J450_9PLEO|nr:hypothetical protein K458DRAFT_451069 [Lentithecium fluviatile CBS 122367]
MQVVSLARKALVTCGSVSLDFDTFCEKTIVFDSWRIDLSLYNVRMRHPAIGNNRRQLWRLMRDFYFAQSSRTIEKVYGFLRLVEESGGGPPIAEVVGVNYEKTVLEVFWDAAFECGAPWIHYSDTLKYIGIMVSPTKRDIPKHIAELGDYVKSCWTSIRHIMFTEIVLRVFEAARIFVKENAIALNDWCRTLDILFKDG